MEDVNLVLSLIWDEVQMNGYEQELWSQSTWIQIPASHL